MKVKTKAIVAIIVCVVIVATFEVASMVEKGLGASAESYGVYVQAAESVIKLVPDGTETLRLPREKLGLPSDRMVGGVAINQADGTIWVWSYGGGMTVVAHLSADGEEILASWTIPQGWVKNLVVDPTDGSVWLSPGYDSYTFKYSADGALLCTLTSPHTHWCPSISVNPAEQTVWMTDGAAGKVIKLRSDGHLILSLSGFSVGWIHHVSVDQTDGSVWVADLDHNEVVKLDTNGNELVRVNVGSMPFFVVANPADGGVWVAFWSEGPVKRLDSSGNVIATSEVIIPGSWVRGLDIAPDGTVWVAETFAHKLHKLSPTGELLLTIDGDPATFYRPQFVSVFPKRVRALDKKVYKKVAEIPIPPEFFDAAILVSGSPEVIVGSLSDFDVHNHYHEPVDNFELELYGIQPSDIVEWFPGWGTPPQIHPISGGTEVIWMDPDHPVMPCEWEHFGLHLKPGVIGVGVKAYWTQRPSANLGDVIHTKIEVTVPSGETATIVDTLPKGLSYLTGTFTVNGVPATPTITQIGPQPPVYHELSYTITESGKHLIEFDCKVDEAKSWEDTEVCNVATATWYDEEGNVTETKEDVECFIIHAFEELHKNVGIPKKVKVIPAPVQFWREFIGGVTDIIVSDPPDWADAVALVRDYAVLHKTEDLPEGYIPLELLTWSETQELPGEATWEPIDTPEDPYILWPGEVVEYDIYTDPNATAVLVRYTVAWASSQNVIEAHFVNEAILEKSSPQVIVGQLSNFDVHNDYHEPVDNFELELYGIQPSDIVEWFPGWGTPPQIHPISGGTEIIWKDATQPVEPCEWVHFGLHLKPGVIATGIKAYWTQMDGGLVIKEKTDVQWRLEFEVTNPFSYTMTDTVITDRFGAEIEIDEPFPYSITHGTVSFTTKGESAKVFLTWDIGDLLPGETARLILLVSTDINPRGHQEYSEPGIYELNSGATLKFIDSEQDMQLSAVTDPIYVTALCLEDC